MSNINNLPDVRTVQLRTPVGYLSFPSLFEARDPWKTGRAKFECSLMVPKDLPDSATALWNDLHKTILKYGVDRFGSSAVEKQADGKFTPAFEVPIHDGDESKFDGNAGYWLIRATANEKFPPRVLGPDNEALEADSGLTAAGSEAELLVGLYYYEYQGKRGVSLNLLAVRCLGGDGIELGPSTMPADSAAKAFGDKPALLGGKPPQIEHDAPKVDLGEVEEFLQV